MSGAAQDVTGNGASWNLGRLTVAHPSRPLVMGVLNLTPDSFFPASRQPGVEAALSRAEAMVSAGAEILDLGAESSRPGSDAVSAAEEQDRLLPVVTALRQVFSTAITVDTCRPETARLALDAGADAINDIAGGREPGMLELVADRGCGLILMHMQGRPRTMQVSPTYRDVVAEVTAWLSNQIETARSVGVKPDRLLIDPGIGFGKTLDHNLALLNALDRVADGHPFLLGASRKSFISHLTGAGVEHRLGGSLAALAAAFRARATVVRVHDVPESIQFLDVLAAITAGGRTDIEPGASA